MSTAAARRCCYSRLCVACSLLLLACYASAESTSASASIAPLSLCCKSPSLIEAFRRPASDENLVVDLLDRMCLIPRIVKLNRTSLDRALEIEDAMVLFYASWCPFSKQILPLFEAFSSLYPSVHHILVEHTEMRPSIRLKYGVRSFPALLFISGSTRIRYYARKDLKHLVKFYRAMTGLPPDVTGGIATTIDWGSRTGPRKQECPYPRAISPENWLSDDLYLALAAGFLLFRLVLYPGLAFIRRRYC